MPDTISTTRLPRSVAEQIAAAHRAAVENLSPLPDGLPPLRRCYDLRAGSYVGTLDGSEEPAIVEHVVVLPDDWAPSADELAAIEVDAGAASFDRLSVRRHPRRRSDRRRCRPDPRSHSRRTSSRRSSSATTGCPASSPTPSSTDYRSRRRPPRSRRCMWPMPAPAVTSSAALKMQMLPNTSIAASFSPTTGPSPLTTSLASE